MTPTANAPRLIVATDGSALNNPGPAGWCWYADEQNWGAQGAAKATNNFAELAAVRDVLLAVPAAVPLELRLDSQYTLSALTKWRFSWARNGWKTGKGAPVANKDLIVEVGALLQGRDVTFVKVRAHQARGGDPRNEVADVRARAAARAYQQGRQLNAGPGYARVMQ